MDNLVRKALLGDREAQRECTEKGILLPCPLCGGKATMQQDITGRESYHVVCSSVKDMCNLIAGLPMWSESEEDALKVWNTRPAPPIGRCKDCVWSREPTKEDYTEIGRDVLAYKDSLMCGFCEDARWKDDFCSYFQPK